MLLLVVCIFLLKPLAYGYDKDYSKYVFPKDFMFGVATSAFQIEGAWNVSGKGTSITDEWFHRSPNATVDHSNGDVACDSYHLYVEDVKMLKNLGVQFYKFSLSWSRILPLGVASVVNPDGIRYYNNLIKELLANGIEPMVTLHHFDAPFAIGNSTGPSSPDFINYFLGYAQVAFDNFGDRVKYWITFNEPVLFCSMRDSSFTFNPDFSCGHKVLQAHAGAYHIYQKKYKRRQKGQVSIILNSSWYEAATKLEKDISAAERLIQFELGWFANPIFTKSGDYSEVLKELVARQSIAKGLNRSELPQFTPQQIKNIRGTADFFALDHYTSYLAKHEKNDSAVGNLETYTQTAVWQDPKWISSTTSLRLKNTPWAFRKLLKWIHKHYDYSTMFITENGWADDGRIYDLERIRYLVSYLSELLDAMEIDKVRIKGYAVWSLLDNFEWALGYTAKYGLYQVDFNDPSRPRKEKISVKIYKRIISNRTLTGKFCD